MLVHTMIADVNITEKSYGPKILMTGVKFSIDDGEKIGLIGRNGVGKSTLFGILSGNDEDYSGEIVYRHGVVVVSTAQEHLDQGDLTVMQYVLSGLPEYAKLSKIIETYPQDMGDDLRKISEYTKALNRFNDKGFYQIEEQIERELDNFQLVGISNRPFSSLSGGEKRLVEVVKVMHSDAGLALIDEPTNHMDYVAKAQYIEWMKKAREAVVVITHDRDVLKEVDRIIEFKDGGCISYKGNYDSYLKQNTFATGLRMHDYENVEKQIVNLRAKIIEYRRLKEKSRAELAIKKFKRLEEKAKQELAELLQIEKPSFWIDQESVKQLDYKVAEKYEKFKARNIRLNLKSDQSRSKHILIKGENLSIGYDKPLFSGVNIDLREGEALEIRGRNGAGKTTLLKIILGEEGPRIFEGGISLDKNIRVGKYEQEVSAHYFDLTLEGAVERMYLDKKLPISTTKIRSILNDYLFDDDDRKVIVSKLSGGQKARFQLISMLANEPQLLILDEPTNHLDLPSIEELEAALNKYSGAVLYVSHDNYFRKAMGGESVQIDI